jgi:hypothetical protein
MDFRMTSLRTSPIFPVRQKKSWWIRNVQRFWFLKNTDFPFPWRHITFSERSQRNAGTLRSQSKGFLWQTKNDVYWKKLGGFSFRHLWRNASHTSPFLYGVKFSSQWSKYSLTVIRLCPHSDLSMALLWSDYVLTVIRLWPYSDQTMALQWSEQGFTVIRVWPHSDQKMALQWSEYGLTVTRIWSYSDQIISSKWSEYGLTVFRLWPQSDQNMTLQWSEYSLIVSRLWPHSDHNMAL